MSLAFDEATHTYRHDGQVIPGVTGILAPLTDLSAVPADILAAASAFGTAVHLATELLDQGRLDMSSVDAALLPYLDAWRQFCSDHGAEWTHIEARLYHPALRYAGTVDRMGVVDGVPSIVDIKTSGVIYPSTGPQTAAYQRAAADGEQKFTARQRLSVQLKADGTYAVKKHTDPADFSVFASLLTLRNWCKRNNVNPKFTGEMK